MIGRHGRRAHHHVGPVRAQHVLLVLADLVRADEDGIVATLLCHEGQPDSGVAEVGSTMVPPGRNSPLASAASIIFTAMRSLALPPGLRYSILAATVGFLRLLAQQVQLHKRGIADELMTRLAMRILHR